MSADDSLQQLANTRSKIRFDDNVLVSSSANCSYSRDNSSGTDEELSTPDSERASTDVFPRFTLANVEFNDDDNVVLPSSAKSGTKISDPGCKGSVDAEKLRKQLSASSLTLEGRRKRTTSGSNADDVIRKDNKVVYTAGRPPWYDCHGSQSREPFFIGICGGSASGKTTVAKSIIELLDVPWVTLLNMDSFYKVLNEDQHHQALENNYNFDHPQAFDFEMLIETLRRLKQGKRVEVPIYNFTSHSREKQCKTMYGASVLILEGILTFYSKEIVDMMDLKIFVDADSDTRLARRLQRDITERGRDVVGVLQQVERFVKPSFDNFIAPSMQMADIIIPRGGDNTVAIDLIARHIHKRLSDGLNGTSRASLAAAGVVNGVSKLMANGVAAPPPSLRMLKQTSQLRCLHTMMRNRETPRDEFVFYSHRIMRLLIEHALSLLPFEKCDVTTPLNKPYEGCHRRPGKVCGVSILRAGEAMETALREVVKDCTISKILIQTNPETLEPELYYLRLPTDIQKYHVLLMDTTVATGAAAIMGIRILLEHDVSEENITLVSLLMSEVGVNTVAYAFPRVKLVTSAVDRQLSKHFHILPGIGNFGNRYFGTENEAKSDDLSDDVTTTSIMNGKNRSHSLNVMTDATDF